MSTNKVKSLSLVQRLHAAMNTVTYVQKDKPSGLRYSIVSHDAVTAKVRPALHTNGIIYFVTDMVHVQSGNRTEVNLVVRFCNIDDKDDYIDVASMGYGLDAQDKGPGKAISYAVKYALLKTLGLETGDDPDLDQETVHAPTPNRRSNSGVEETRAGSGTKSAPAKAEKPSIKGAVAKAPTWPDWAHGVITDLTGVKNEKERVVLRDRISAAFKLCEKEDADSAKQVREALKQVKEQIVAEGSDEAFFAKGTA